MVLRLGLKGGKKWDIQHHVSCSECSETKTAGKTRCFEKHLSSYLQAFCRLKIFLLQINHLQIEIEISKLAL